MCVGGGGGGCWFFGHAASIATVLSILTEHNHSRHVHVQPPSHSTA